MEADEGGLLGRVLTTDEGKHAAGHKVDESDFNPFNFSQLDLGLSDAELTRQFPRFPGKRSALECYVTAGEMLYMPSGWFHEVPQRSDVTRAYL